MIALTILLSSTRFVHSKTVLLTLGRLPVALELARAFSGAGMRVVIAEPQAMHLCRWSNSVDRSVVVASPVDDEEQYLQSLLAVIKAEAVDLVVPVSEEFAYIAGLNKRVPKHVRVFCQSKKSVLSLHDKYQFNQIAAEFGLPVPETALPGSEKATILMSAPCVIKPRYACSGNGVSIFNAALTPDQMENQAANTDNLIQKKCNGAEYSSFSIVQEGVVIQTVVYQSKICSRTVGVCFERIAEAPLIEDWISVFVIKSGYTGFLSFDFIIEEGVARAIECNPRTNSGLHFLKPGAIAAAIGVGKHDGSPFKENALMVESYSCFTALLVHFFSFGFNSANWRVFRKAKDVCWRRNDRCPFLTMTVNSYPLLFRALTKRKTFAEVAMSDMEWRKDNVD